MGKKGKKGQQGQSQQGEPQPGTSQSDQGQPPQRQPGELSASQQKKQKKQQQLLQQQLQQQQEQQEQEQQLQKQAAPQQPQEQSSLEEGATSMGSFPTLGAAGPLPGKMRARGRGRVAPFSAKGLQEIAETLPPPGFGRGAARAQSPGGGFPAPGLPRGRGPIPRQQYTPQQPPPQRPPPQRPPPQRPPPQRPPPQQQPPPPQQQPPQQQPPQQQPPQQPVQPSDQQQQQRPAPGGGGGDVQEADAAQPPPLFRGGLQIPTRECRTVAGKSGREIRVRTNHLALNLKNLRTKIAYHYDVSIDPDKPKKLLRRAVEEFRLRNFSDRYPAFDGRKNLYSASLLPFDHKREFRDTVSVADPEMQRQREFKVTLKFATQVDLTSLSTYMKTGSSLVAPQQAIQVLDVVLRCAPALWFVPVGRSYFTPPSGSIEPLGDGYEIWYGLFQSVNLGWQPFVNVDVVHKGFPSSQPVINVINEICGGGRTTLDLNRGLDEYQQGELRKFLGGLKVDYMLPNNPSSKRTYKVNGLAAPASTLSFKLDNGNSVTVQKYFEQEKKITLRYKNLPCLHVGSLRRENPIYVPLEFCTITAGQVTQKKLNERQTSNMIRKAATSTQDRERKIRDALARANFNGSKQVTEFGLQVNESFQEIKARVLAPPSLEYKSSTREAIVPSRGVWQAKQFLDGKRLGKWVVLVLDFRVSPEDIGKFVSQFIQQGRNLGMEINAPLPMRKMDSRRIRSELEPFLRGCNKEDIELVVVVVPERGNEYALVKQTAELQVGVLTQCVKASTMSRRMNFATAQNILLKVNSKLNGVNHSMHSKSRPKIFANPIMIVGADVTHPSPDETKIPSVAAVCASHDPNAFQYNTQFRLQPARTEIIRDLREIMKQHLMFFYCRTNGMKPQRILFYRDGVSEGQFQQVLDSELTAIRSACSALEKDYKPAITFLVVQKRHHTRFFPIDKKDSDGRNCNVLPGTIVDTTITHPTERDFYLVSHASIQGVSRPTKYHCLWDDNNLSEDELEELTYFLCHMFSRCTRSVSYPAPTYYAHLAAYRARVYLNGQNMDTLTDERLRTQLLEKLQKQSPMFFV